MCLDRKIELRRSQAQDKWLPDEMLCFENRNLGIWVRIEAKIKKLFKLEATKHIGEF